MARVVCTAVSLAVLWLACCVPATGAEPRSPAWINPWQNRDGSLRDGCVVISSHRALASPNGGSSDVTDAVLPVRAEDFPLVGDTGGGSGRSAPGSGSMPPIEDYLATYETMGSRRVRAMPRDEFNRLDGAGADMPQDRGIDSADTKWRRQARLTGVRMRMLNGPEAMISGDGYSSDTERGVRTRQGAVVPVNARWELAALNRLNFYSMKEGGDAGLEAVTVRLGANPSVSFRPWVAVTPYSGFGDADGVGLGISGGLSKRWSSGITLTGEAYAFEPWDEGYETAVEDGRSHGLRIEGSLPVDRRLTLSGGVEYEWLELGPHARSGSQSAGRRGNWTLRAEWLLLKRDGAFMGYGFREPTLWNEQLVPVELGLFADIYWQRYIKPRGFDALNPTRKSLRERVGVFYNQAISPHLGVNAEAYVGQDTRRQIDPGDLYGFSVRLNYVISPHLRLWCGWGYESASDNLEGGGGPDRNFSAGLHGNF